jgi:Glu-tRNA(Gln) amidotransferase subunit E-like FAD-binding protein
MSVDEDRRRPLDGILEGLAESVAREDPQELLEEARAAGQNPEAIAERLKNIVSAALKTFEQRKLDTAREAYRAHSSLNPEKKDKIARTPAERRRQLSAIQLNNPEIAAVLTTQYRGFETSSDEDIESMLEDLAELGFLDDSPQTSDD